MIASRIVVYGAKKLMDKDIFLVMVKNTLLLWVFAIMFLCFDVKG